MFQLTLCCRSLNCPDHVMVDLFCLFKDSIDFVSIFIGLYNPFLDW